MSCQLCPMHGKLVWHRILSVIAELRMEAEMDETLCLRIRVWFPHASPQVW